MEGIFMPDTRRQTIIIGVLIVLIAVAGVFAKRFNEGVQSTSAGQTQDEQAATTLQQMRITHQNDNSASKQDYEAIIRKAGWLHITIQREWPRA
jgi:uncharacterized protein YpmB